MRIEDFLQGLSLPVLFVIRVSWYSFFVSFSCLMCSPCFSPFGTSCFTERVF
ncbi:hypothetical protein OIU78_001775 [Salix suchowensis]|nr:hypothetical protein OIU78_001775 [Salix suchowensis]